MKNKPDVSKSAKQWITRAEKYAGKYGFVLLLYDNDGNITRCAVAIMTKTDYKILKDWKIEPFESDNYQIERFFRKNYIQIKNKVDVCVRCKIRQKFHNTFVINY